MVMALQHGEGPHPYLDLSALVNRPNTHITVRTDCETFVVGNYPGIGEFVRPFIQVSVFSGKDPSTAPPSRSFIVTDDNNGSVSGPGKNYKEGPEVAAEIAQEVTRATRRDGEAQ